MKKCMSILILGFALQASAQPVNEKVEGSGSLKTEERPLANFTAIESRGSFDIVITQDAAQKVAVKTDDNIMPYVVTEVSGGKLKIHFSDRYRNYAPTSATVYVSAALLEDIGLAGSGTVSRTNQLKSKNPHYAVSGSGKMNLFVVAEAIETSVSGSGRIELKGSASSAKYKISGSGKTHALAMACPDVRVKISGSGDCFVHAEKSLDASISGSGEVKYKGNPAITRSIVGSGTITQH